MDVDVRRHQRVQALLPRTLGRPVLGPPPPPRDTNAYVDRLGMYRNVRARKQDIYMHDQTNDPAASAMTAAEAAAGNTRHSFWNPPPVLVGGAGEIRCTEGTV